MALDPDRCWEALSARDRRFEGRFVVGVRTTGVYCRPGCPARLPSRRNVRFFAHPAAAEAAGFRACLRCRPEAAPGQPASAGTSATVARALRLIGEGALDEGTLVDLAARLGVGGRHLTRLFREHLGVPPGAVARARRVHFARQLLDETDLPVAEIAFGAGFRSLRRFNEAVREAFGAPPSALRARRVLVPAAGPWIRVPYRPPLDWAALHDYLSARAVPGVERAEAGGYVRTTSTPEGPALVEVRPAATGQALELRLTPPRPAALLDAATRVRCLFDLDADPEVIAAALGADPLLGRAVRARPGLRVPGGWDPFEVVVRAVVGQQVSVAAAARLAGRIAERCGEVVPAAGFAGLTRLFPAPAAIAATDPARLPLPRARAESLVALAAAVARGELALRAGAGLEETLSALRGRPGVGPWTEQYVAMRALREPDAFPAGDLALRRALGAGVALAESEALARAEAWRPWRAYAAQHLWALDAERRVRGSPAIAGLGA
ncbi:MAG TPA: AlkA N-terminal domain-containing protein [Anaeromyxobacter sp.]|nr:AlkA N-terminal domain-containing protein [Anaeromyxobacter sp.]